MPARGLWPHGRRKVKGSRRLRASQGGGKPAQRACASREPPAPNKSAARRHGEPSRSWLVAGRRDCSRSASSVALRTETSVGGSHRCAPPGGSGGQGERESRSEAARRPWERAAAGEAEQGSRGRAARLDPRPAAAAAAASRPGSRGGGGGGAPGRR